MERFTVQTRGLEMQILRLLCEGLGLRPDYLNWDISSGDVMLCDVSATAVMALVFDVPSGSSKCLTEELRRRAVSHASYRVVAESTSAADRRILVRVTGPRGEELYVAEGGERGEFRFEAAEDGEHTACFWSPRYERGAIVSVDVQEAAVIGAKRRARQLGELSMPAAALDFRTVVG